MAGQQLAKHAGLQRAAASKGRSERACCGSAVRQAAKKLHAHISETHHPRPSCLVDVTLQDTPMRMRPFSLARSPLKAAKLGGGRGRCAQRPLLLCASIVQTEGHRQKGGGKGGGQDRH